MFCSIGWPGGAEGKNHRVPDYEINNEYVKSQGYESLKCSKCKRVVRVREENISENNTFQCPTCGRTSQS